MYVNSTESFDETWRTMEQKVILWWLFYA